MNDHDWLIRVTRKRTSPRANIHEWTGMNAQAPIDEPMNGLRIRPRADLMGCELGEGLALLDTRSGVYFQLNEVGAFVWNALDGRTVSDIATGVARAYAVPADQAPAVHDDVRAMLRDMLENGLVTADDAAAA